MPDTLHLDIERCSIELEKNLSKNVFHLDLTKVRFTLYQKAKDLIKSKKSVKYVYVAVNCRLKIEFEGNNAKQVIIFSSELLDLNDQENKAGVLGHGAEETNVENVKI